MPLGHCYAFGFVAVAFRSKEEVSWRRDPHDLFLPRPGSAPGRIWPKNNNTCKGPWVLHAYQVSSKSIKRFWRRSRKSEKFTPDGRRRRRTDDGRCAMTIAHSSLRLRWAKNSKEKNLSLKKWIGEPESEKQRKSPSVSRVLCSRICLKFLHLL